MSPCDWLQREEGRRGGIERTGIVRLAWKSNRRVEMDWLKERVLQFGD